MDDEMILLKQMTKFLLTALQIFSLSFFWISKPKKEMNPRINPMAATVNCKNKVFVLSFDRSQ